LSLPDFSVTSARRVPGRKVIAHGSLKAAASCTVKGASASAVAGCAPDVSSAALSVAALLGVPVEQAATASAADSARAGIFCMKRLALLGR
jgi:hypothetical protein